MFHVLLKPILENFEHFTLLVCEMSAIVGSFYKSLLTHNPREHGHAWNSQDQFNYSEGQFMEKAYKSHSDGDTNQ